MFGNHQIESYCDNLTLNIDHSTFPIPLYPSRFSRKSRESRTNNADWLFERKENRLKNHTPQGKLPPQPIATTTHPPHPYPDLRRVRPSGEVREWPNRAVSKTAVLATGPWVRSPPSPPIFKRLCLLVRVTPARCLLHGHWRTASISARLSGRNFILTR